MIKEMACTMEKELQHHLFEAGKRLEHPPQSKDELFKILEQVESCLSKVEQSPSEAMLDAVCPSMNALVTPELLRHPDKDVGLIVVTCISEITRITAPEAPYNDDLMREIFQLIVASFQGLDDISSPSFGRRVTILETVAKVRSCVVMLDLECDDLILEMFQHFFATARENHPENVITSMRTIMTLVLDESEDISQQLLSVLLTSLRREKRDVSPAAHRLAIHVAEHCAIKLKPYLTSEMSAEGISQSDLQKEYHEIIFEICQGPLHMVHTSQELLVDGSHLPTSLPTSVVANDVLPHSEFANMNEGGQVSPDHKQLNGNEVKSVPEEHEKDDNEGLLQKSCNSNAKETGKENNSDIPSLGTVKLHKGRRRGHSKKSTGAVKPEHDNAQDSKILESEKPSDQVGGVVKGEPNKLLDSKNLEADKPSDEVAAVVKIEANKSRDSRNLEADKPSDQVAGVEKIQPDNLQDSRSLESDKPSDRVKNRRESRKAALLELFKSADKNQVGSDPETLLSSKRKRGRSSKEAKHVPSPGQSTKDAIGLGSPARSNEETVGLISPARSNEETLGLSSPAQSNKETVVLGPPDQSSKEAAGYASPARSNKETVGLVSVARSNKVVVGSASPARSSKETAALASPAQSTKQSVRLASPARSSKDTASLASPSQKQSPPEDGRTESSRPRRGRPKSAGRKLDVKEESVLPGLTPVTTERVSDGLAATEMTPRSPNSNQEMETSKDSVTKSSKRSKRRLDPSHDNTPKSMDKISHGIPVASGETDTPDANQEDGYRPKKMQKVTSLPQSAEKNSSEAGESSKRTPRNSTKKKSISGMEKTPEAAGEGSAEDEKFVGRRIKVWWPRDKQFYEGIVDSYDPKQKKHKILYSDGDVEVLKLERQRWEFIDVNPVTEKVCKFCIFGNDVFFLLFVCNIVVI
eukprot:Gb_09525 [translate_table: standard]